MNIRYPIYEGVYRILTLHTLSLKEPKREMKEANGQPVKKKSNGLKR